MGRIRKIKNADILIKNYHWLLQKASDHYFNNSHQLYIEVGSGKGDFIIQNALKYPDINFIGIEKDKTIVLKILRKIDTLSIKPINLLIICDDAKNLLVWFKINSISKIFLNFSDP
jgi:tRNA (guanine-N7-)-methyltransferase